MCESLDDGRYAKCFSLLCHHLTTTKKLLLGCLLWEWWYRLPGNVCSFKISHSQGTCSRSTQFACTNSPRSPPRALRRRLIVSRRVGGAGSSKFVEQGLMKSRTQMGKTCRLPAALSVCDRQCQGGTTARLLFLSWAVVGTGKLWELQLLSGMLCVGATSHQGTLVGNLETCFFVNASTALSLVSRFIGNRAPSGLWLLQGDCGTGSEQVPLSAHLSVFTFENRNYVSCSWLLSAVEFPAVLHCKVKWSWRGDSEGGNSLYKTSPNIQHLSATILYGLFIWSNW